MVRASVIPETNQVNVKIPDNYIGKKVEVLVFAEEDVQVEEKQEKNPFDISRFRGMFSEERAKEFQAFATEIRNEWKRDI